MSQVDFVENILGLVGKNLHISEIIKQVEKVHNVNLDRESIVSSLTKKVARGDRFVKTGKNTFGLLKGDK